LKTLSRVIHKVASVGVHGFGLPPAWLGFAHIPTASWREHVGSGGARRLDPVYPVRALAECRTVCYEVSDARIAWYADQWGNDFCIALSGRDVLLPVHGTEINGGFGLDVFHGHSEILRMPCLESYESAIWVAKNWSHNYFHWLIYVLPGVIQAAVTFPDLPLIIPNWHRYPTFAAESLRLCGIESDRIIVPMRQHLRIKRLIVPDVGEYDPASLRYLRRLLLQGVGGDLYGPRRVLLTRSSAPRRRLSNEPELCAALKDHDFLKIDPGSLALRQQIQTFASTRLLVGSHGAALTNALFMDTNSAVVELRFESTQFDHYRKLCAALGVTYVSIPCQRSDSTADADLTADINAALTAVNDVLREQGNGVYL